MSRSTLRVAATYIGAVMGAGFASGQEIVQFFIVYREKGILGILMAGGLFALLGFGALMIIKQHRINSYQELFLILLGRRLGAVCEILITVFLFAGLVIMLAGSGAVFQEYFGLAPTLGILLTSLAVWIALASKGEGVMWINTVLIPLKLLICVAVSFAVLSAVPPQVDAVSSLRVPSRPWFISAVLYVSFNMTFALVVLASLGREIRGNVAGGALGGIGLGIFALAIGLALFRYYPAVGGYQVPMVHIAFRVSPQMGIFYLLVLWFAMITAAVGNAFSFIKRVTRLSAVPYQAASLAALGAAVPLAHFQFSSLVAVVYPLFGYIGLLTLGPLIYMLLRRRS